MKRILLLSLSTVLTGAVFAQAQIGNSDMENWEVVAGSDEEPVNWSSFLTAQGSLTSFAANQIEQEADPRPGSTGSTCARIWSRDAGFGIVANGNMTCGRINMGNLSASNPDNHNLSLTSNPEFSEALTDTPDSIVFWVKYNAASGSSEARMKATLHDDFDYTDPETGTSADHIVATAELNYSPTNDTWVRKSVPFDYSGPATVNTFILVTFASNAVPGGGDADDEVFVDDIELIYNDASTGEIPANEISVAMDNDLNMINVLTDSNLEGQYNIYNTAGQLVQSGDVATSIPFEERTGIYFFHIITASGSYKYEIYKK